MRYRLTALFTLFLLSTAVHAQDSNEGLKQELKKVLDRVESLEKELKELRTSQRNLPADPDERKLQLYIEQAYFGQAYSRKSNKPQRFLVAKLTVLNLTEKPVELNREQIKLKTDGKLYEPLAAQKLKSHRDATFRIDQQHHSIHRLSILEKMRIPSGRAKSDWVVFMELPTTQIFPEMELQIESEAGPPTVISINQMAADLLDLQVERIGPHQSLGLITINGQLNTLSAGQLMKSARELADLKTTRLVVNFSDTAAKIESQVSSWLIQQSRPDTAGIQNTNSPFPPLPNQIRAFHLAAMPLTGSNKNSGGEYQHKTVEEAVESALKAAYEILPRNELLTEIKDGHDLTRTVALKHGGGRLLEDQLPLILELADHDDPRIQKAALYCLRKFNSDPAFDKLEEYVRKDLPQISEVAIESMSASLFRGAHERLLNILENQPPDSKVEIVKILANNPRPIWSDTIYQFLKENQNEDYQLEALMALDRIGHPELFNLLKDSLESPSKKVQKLAFGILIQRSDQESEKIAVQYMIDNISEYPDNQDMHKLLSRTRDQRAIPLLLEQLDVAGSKRRNIINALSTIGDQSVVPKLLSIYDTLNRNEKSAVLKTLGEINSPELIPLAKRELTNKDNSLFYAAIQALRSIGKTESNQALIEAFKSTDDIGRFRNLAEVLAQVKTKAAKKAMLEESQNKWLEKRKVAYMYLKRVENDSPAYQYVYNGNNAINEKKMEEALKQFDMAIKIDDECAPAYSGKGNVLFKLERFDEAGNAFELALKYDPYDMMSVTGNSILKVRDDKPDEAFKYLEEQRARHIELLSGIPQSKRSLRMGTYAYNVACVYGVALEYLRANQKEKYSPEEFEKRETTYQDKAITELNKSVKLGFDDFNWMREDPDLKSLHENEEFRKISKWPENK